MADLLQETEAVPASYPDVAPRWLGGENEADALFDVDFGRDPGSDQVWQRIEAYTRERYTPREVVWVFQAGEGETWTPPLGPLVSRTDERWEGGAWVTTILPDGPVGLCVPSDGTFRVTATVGAGVVPPAVREAFLRLHEYSRGIAESFKEEAATYAESTGQAGTSAPVAWAARAIQLSGAADALRAYRRLK